MDNQEEIQIKRERIIRAIDNNISNFTILTAPIGYGKVKATQAYIETKEFKSNIWLHIKDKDKEYIWKDFCQQIAKVKPSVAKKIKSLGIPSDPKTLDKIVDVFKTDIKKKICIVFDGFSMIQKNNLLNQLLFKLMNEKIDNVYIMIITEDSIDNDFLEMSIQGYCNIIDQNILSFNDFETKEYMCKNGLLIDDNHAKKIHKLTGGWLFLVKLIKKEYNYSNDQNIFPVTQEYAKRILFDRREQQEKDIILKLSVIDEFDMNLAKYISGQSFMEKITEHILNEGMIFLKDSERNTYAIYPLLKNALKGELVLNNIDKKSIIKKCALWYELQNDYLKSILLYIKAVDKQNVLRLLEMIKVTKNEKVLRTLKTVFDFLGEEKYLNKEKYMSFIFLYTLVISTKDGVNEYEVAKQYYETNEELQKDKRFEGIMSFIGCFIKFNDVEKMLPLMKQANDSLGKVKQKNNEIEFLFGVYSLIFVVYRSPGTLKQILKMGKECLHYYSQIVLGHDSGTDFLMEADFSLLTGEYTKAENEAKRAVFKAKLSKNYDILICADFILLRLYMLLKTRKDCDTIIKEIESVKDKVNASTVDMIIGYYYSCIGDVEKIPEWIQNTDIQGCKLLKKLNKIAYISMATAMVAQKRYLELEVFAIMLKDIYIQSEHYALGTIYAYIFLSIAKFNNGEKNEALELLDRAINLSEFDNIVEPFIELAAHILPLLEKLAKNNQFAKNILGNCKASKNILENKKSVEYEFTEREKQIIKFMLDGYKQAEIADDLYISLPTVKKHVQNIYRKLGISSKSEAIKILKNFF